MQISKPGQPKQPARIAEKQPEVPCRHDLRPTPPTVISFPSSCSHLRRITDIESVATIGGVRSTYRTMQASCIPRCLHCAIFRPAVLPLGTRAPPGQLFGEQFFHVACMRPAAPCTASFRALSAVWTILCALKPRDSEASIRTALRDVQCPRCNGYGRPRIIALARHPSI